MRPTVESSRDALDQVRVYADDDRFSSCHDASSSCKLERSPRRDRRACRSEAIPRLESTRSVNAQEREPLPMSTSMIQFSEFTEFLSRDSTVRKNWVRLEMRAAEDGGGGGEDELVK